jgi:hypothetical protein
MGAKLEDAYSTGLLRSPIRKELMDLVEPGRRNTTMASRIGYLLRKLDEDLAWSATQKINDECCKPPLNYNELQRTFRSILKREKRNV